MLCPAIDNPVICEIRALIRLLQATYMGDAELHRDLSSAVYGQTELQKELQDNGAKCSNIGEEMTTMEREVVSRPSELSDGTVETDDSKSMKDDSSQVHTFRMNFL
jgi:hypothetical protein